MSDRASSPTPPPVPTSQQTHQTVATEVPVKEESPSSPPPTSTAAPNTSPTPAAAPIPSSAAPNTKPPSPGRCPRTTVAQRRAMLRDDPQCAEAEPHRILCRMCGKWIKLSQAIEYSLSNWRSHKLRCRRSPLPTPSRPILGPNGRVAIAERKIVLLNDPQVKAFSTANVHCGTCKTIVSLEGEVDYDLSKWIEHKKKCIPMTPPPITLPPPSTSSTHSQVSVVRSARSPSPTPAGEGSSQSTETTVIPESSAATVKIGVKRGRKEESEDEVEVERVEPPTNRPRTETHDPRTKNLLGWLVQPLKEFARGFREGLGST